MTAVVDFPVKPEARPYLEAFDKGAGRRADGEPHWVADRRRRAMARFAEAGFPSRKSESWRYLDLQPLQRAPLLPAEPAPETAGPSGLAVDPEAVRMVLRDGTGALLPAESALPEGLWIAPLRRAMAERPDLVRALVGDDGGDDDPMGALNTALFADGVVVDVAPGAVIDRTIEIAHVAASPGSVHTRSLINLGAGSRATVVETYAGTGRYWRNDVVAAHLAAGARLARTVVVEEAAEAIHTARIDLQLAAGARLDGFALLLGGSRVRQEWTARLEGEGARCAIDGAFVVDAGDEANIVTAIDHAAPGGQTRELIKGVASGRGHGAFQGRIVVREDAQKTDAHQLSRNLILGRRAVIDTKPELEIYADDVKCSHGASVGDLDPAALFYLEARGIAPDEARRMLVAGFLREAVEAIEHGRLRDHLLRRLEARLDRLEAPR